jgi:hypothetical protein
MGMVMGTTQFIFFRIYLPGGPDVFHYLLSSWCECTVHQDAERRISISTSNIAKPPKPEANTMAPNLPRGSGGLPAEMSW